MFLKQTLEHSFAVNQNAYWLQLSEDFETL